MTFYIENIKIELTENKHGLQLTTADGKLLLPGQTFAETMDIIHRNFEILKSQYLKTASSTIETVELNEVCLKIVLFFFGIYNSWKYSNEKQKDLDLTFQPKDFNHPYTQDIVVQYFKNKYPNDYAGKCGSILGITADKLLRDEYNRASFYNDFR